MEKKEGRTKRRIRKNCDDAFNVNNFRLRFYVFNYRVAASLWQRDETTAKLDEAGLRSNPHSRHFLRSSHYQDCVCCVCACVYTCACLRLFSLRYVFYSAPRRLNDLHSPSPPRSLPRTKIPSTVLGNTEIATFFPLKERTIRSFLLLLLLLFCAKVSVPLEKRCGFEKRKVAK